MTRDDGKSKQQTHKSGAQKWQQANTMALGTVQYKKSVRGRPGLSTRWKVSGLISGVTPKRSNFFCQEKMSSGI